MRSIYLILDLERSPKSPSPQIFLSESFYAIGFTSNLDLDLVLNLDLYMRVTKKKKKFRMATVPYKGFQLIGP